MKGPTSFVIISKFGRTFSVSNLFEPVPERWRYANLPYKLSSIVFDRLRRRVRVQEDDRVDWTASFAYRPA